MKSKPKSSTSKSSKTITIVDKPDLRVTQETGRIAQVFLNVDLRNSHDGLLAIARKNGLDVHSLKPGQYLVFLNEQRNRFKIFAPAANRRGLVVLYYKSYDGRVAREEIEAAPLAFGVKQPLHSSQRVAQGLDESLKLLRARPVNP